MNKEIKIVDEVKVSNKKNLEKVELVLEENINKLAEVIELLNSLNGNPQIFEVINKSIDIRDAKVVVKNNIAELKNKVDLNLEKMQTLEQEIATKMGE